LSNLCIIGHLFAQDTPVPHGSPFFLAVDIAGAPSCSRADILSPEPVFIFGSVACLYTQQPWVRRRGAAQPLRQGTLVFHPVATSLSDVLRTPLSLLGKSPRRQHPLMVRGAPHPTNLSVPWRWGAWGPVPPQWTNLHCFLRPYLCPYKRSLCLVCKAHCLTGLSFPVSAHVHLQLPGLDVASPQLPRAQPWRLFSPFLLVTTGVPSALLDEVRRLLQATSCSTGHAYLLMLFSPLSLGTRLCLRFSWSRPRGAAQPTFAGVRRASPGVPALPDAPRVSSSAYQLESLRRHVLCLSLLAAWSAPS
jgi:hypothetical protein